MSGSKKYSDRLASSESEWVGGGCRRRQFKEELSDRVTMWSTQGQAGSHPELVLLWALGMKHTKCGQRWGQSGMQMGL